MPKQYRINYRLAVLTSGLMLSGCVTSYQQDMENWAGNVQQCYQSGVSDIGKRMAAMGHQICRNALASLGYLPEQQVGVTGISELRQIRGQVHVDAVQENSPAQLSGIKANDQILSINGRRASNVTNTQQQLFGPAGTRASLLLFKGDIQALTVLVRSQRPVTKTDSKTLSNKN